MSKAYSVLTNHDCLTVRDLIERLEDMNPDALVVFEDDYKDICHTMQALPVVHVDELNLDYEAELKVNHGYSESEVEIRYLDEDEVNEDEPDDEAEAIVVLRFKSAN